MVLKLGAQKLYTFYSQPAAEVVLALNELVAAKERLEIFTPNSKGIFDAATILSKQLQNTDPNILVKIDKVLISLISVDLIKNFIANPSDQDLLVSLSSQILLVSAATDNLSAGLKEIKPYSDEEMDLVLQGKLPYYDDILFVYTLRQMISGAIVSEYVGKLLGSLSTAPKEDDYESAEFYWLEVLISGLILQLAWANFADLSISDRKFLLQNYFYQSLVMGVPVRDRVLLAFNGMNPEDLNKEFDSLIRALDYNLEFIPATAEAAFGVKVSETVHQALALIYEEEIKTFAQEKFITSFYKDETNNDAMRQWLRELLRLIIGLHQHSL